LITEHENGEPAKANVMAAHYLPLGTKQSAEIDLNGLPVFAGICRFEFPQWYTVIPTPSLGFFHTSNYSAISPPGRSIHEICSILQIYFRSRD
jgi:hypothetical protein